MFNKLFLKMECPRMNVVGLYICRGGLYDRTDIYELQFYTDSERFLRGLTRQD